MVRRIYIKTLVIGVLFLATLAIPMVDLNEEFSTPTEQEKSGIISESASLSEAQKQAIQVALAKMFGDQIASTSVYSEIVSALAAAMATPEVAQSSNRFVEGLKDLVKIFFKNIELSDEQLAKVRDLLETLKSLAMLQMTSVDPQAIDDTTRNKIEALQERLSAHMVPMSVGAQSILSQETINVYQKQIVQLILDLIKDVLAVLPAGSKITGAGNPPPLAEPMVPENIVMPQDGSEE